jgi:hypothetical protein
MYGHVHTVSIAKNSPLQQRKRQKTAVAAIMQPFILPIAGYKHK